MLKILGNFRKSNINICSSISRNKWDTYFSLNHSICKDYKLLNLIKSKHFHKRREINKNKTKVTQMNTNENIETKKSEEKASFYNFVKYFKPYLKIGNVQSILIKALILTIFSKGLISLSPYLMKITIDQILSKTYIVYPIIFLIASSLSRVIGTGIQELRQILLNRVSSVIMINFSKDMMNYLMKIEYSIFKNSSETVTNHFTKSLQGLDRLNRFIVGNLLSNGVEMIIVTIMLYALLGPKYVLNTLATYIFYLYVTKKISNKRMKIIRDKYQSEINSENKIFDIVYNIDTVKYFQREEKEAEKFSSIIKEVREKDEKVVWSLSIMNTTQALILAVGMSINLGMGIYDCYYNKMTPGDLVMLQAIYSQVVLPLNWMGVLMREIDESRVNLQYAINMIDEKEKEKVKQKEKTYKLFNFQGGKIEFKDVNFVFKSSSGEEGNQSKLILNNANAIFEKNTMNAIVGFSGQGKSTLFQLLFKLYDVNGGKILIDSQDLSEIDTDSYRKHLTICPQNGHLFNESILYNIAYGNQDASIDEIEKISEEVNLLNKINSLNDKFNSNVGSLGSKLSGGEKQRLLLARSFIKNSDIMLLDEPTSNLDNLNENRIIEYLKKIKKNKTILISAHKLTTITHCDMIYVLNKGIFEEIGTHYNLMQKKGLYYDMFTKHVFKE